MASRIGRAGGSKGPSKTKMAGGGRVTGNLGKTTSMKRTGNNHDVVTAFKRKTINPGPGGTQIV